MKADFRRRGFTLIEMLTVIVIILILAGLLVTVLQKARQKAHRLKAATEARDLVKAWQSYYETYREFPGTNDIEMTAAMVDKLQQNNAPSAGSDFKIKFYQFPLNATNDGFRDPWGKLYRVSLSSSQTTNNWSFATRVYFVHRRREQYE